MIWPIGTPFNPSANEKLYSGLANDTHLRWLWAARPYDAELATLRQRVELLDFVAQRIITMTPAERRQFGALMKFGAPSKR